MVIKIPCKPVLGIRGEDNTVFFFYASLSKCSPGSFLPMICSEPTVIPTLRWSQRAEARVHVLFYLPMYGDLLYLPQFPTL